MLRCQRSDGSPISRVHWIRSIDEAENVPLTRARSGAIDALRDDRFTKPHFVPLFG
jgi:hypothetical protein